MLFHAHERQCCREKKRSENGAKTVNKRPINGDTVPFLTFPLNTHHHKTLADSPCAFDDTSGENYGVDYGVQESDPSPLGPLLRGLGLPRPPGGAGFTARRAGRGHNRLRRLPLPYVGTLRQSQKRALERGPGVRFRGDVLFPRLNLNSTAVTTIRQRFAQGGN